MKFKTYLDEQNSLNESNITSYIKGLKKLSGNSLKNLLKDSFNKFTKLLVDNDLEDKFLKILNKQFKTSYKSLKQLKSLKESNLNEDWKNFLMFWKSETYPALAIFPTLQIWFQLDKLIDGAGIKDLDWKKIAIYAVLWVIIVSGQHVLLFKKWKKQNPDEWEKEGKPGVLKKGRRKVDAHIKGQQGNYLVK